MSTGDLVIFIVQHVRFGHMFLVTKEPLNEGFPIPKKTSISTRTCFYLERSMSLLINDGVSG
jgi:hypothetical protein